MLYKSPTTAMAGGDSKLSFSVENILKDHRKSNNCSNLGGSSSELQPNARSRQIMRTKLTRRHYSTSSIETIGLGTGYLSRGRSMMLDSDLEMECRSLDTYTSSPSPLSSPRSVASLPQECLQGDEKVSSPSDHHEEFDDQSGSSPPLGGSEHQSDSASHTPKRGRMRFTPEQIQVLERRFQEQHYLLPADRKILSLALQLTERQVKTWFQNKRAQYKRTRPLVRHPIYHNVYPSFPHGCHTASQPLQLTSPCSPSFLTTGGIPGLIGAVNSSAASLRELSLLCTIPPSPLHPTCAVTTPTFPSSSPLSTTTPTPNYFQIPAVSSFNLTYPSHIRSPITTPK